MADTTANIAIPKSQWIDLYSASGIPVGTKIIVENVGDCDIQLAVSATQPPRNYDKFNILSRSGDGILANSSGDSGAWAYCNNQTGKVNVTRADTSAGFQPLINSGLHDGYGNPIGSLKGAIDVHNADVHNSIINKYVRRYTGVSTTLTTATTGDGTEYTIDVADVTGFAINDYIDLDTTDEETTMPRIISSSVVLPGSGPGTFTLDRRLDVAHNIGDTVSVAVTDMSSITATMAAPVIYFAQPFGAEVWHLTRLIFEMTHGTAGDLGLFGDLPVLQNGVLLRAKVSGKYYTFTNWKKNSNIKTDMYDVEFDPRSGGGGSYGTTGRGTFTRLGSVVRLDAAQGDRFEVVVQDDITGLESFTMKLQGHFEGF